MLSIVTTQSQLLLPSIVATFVVMLIIFGPLFYRLYQNGRAADKVNCKCAVDAVSGLIKEISHPSRHRWIDTPEGEMIQFVYLLLGRTTSDPKIGHLVWAEVTIRRNGDEVKVFHTPEVDGSDVFLTTVAETLRKHKFAVTVVKTDKQPDLDQTGVEHWDMAG